MIYFEQVLPQDSATAVRVSFKVGVYGYAGRVTRVGKIEAIRVDADSERLIAGFDITSQGTAHVRMRGQYTIWPAASYPGVSVTSLIEGLGTPDALLPEGVLASGFVPNTPVLPGSRRRIFLQARHELAAGNYILDLNGHLEGVSLDRGIPFSVGGQEIQVAASSESTPEGS